MEPPFRLRKYHKTITKNRWIRYGLKVTEEEFELLYYKYIYTTNCELCNKEFKSSKNRHMEHNHETGEFRNIVCTRCNLLKADVKISKNNTSGHKGIYKEKKKVKQGFIWVFSAYVDGKLKSIKSSIDLNKVVEFAEKWKKDNNYNT